MQSRYSLLIKVARRLCSLACLHLCLVSPTAHSLAQAGVVSAVAGQAWIGEKAARPGQTVNVGDTAKTGPNSVLQLLLLDETSFTLGANGSLAIDHFIYPGEATKVQVGVQRGTFKFSSGKAAKTNIDAMKVALPMV